MFDRFLLWLESTPPAIAISESSWLFPGIESIHVLAITLVVGSITMVDLRLLGINLRERPVGELIAEVLPWTRASFAVAVCSGALLFSSNATTPRSTGRWRSGGASRKPPGLPKSPAEYPWGYGLAW